jgi:hypothetical protein
MKELLLWIFIAGFLFLAFMFFIIKGVKNKNRRNIFISFGFLFLTAIACFWTIYLFGVKSYHTVTEVFKPRSGLEIYTSLFHKPVGNCLTVINKQDQIVPKLDCCIWLEFQTCPDELSRIISQESYKISKYLSADTSSYDLLYGPKPEWWKPSLLGDSIIVMQNNSPHNPNRERTLIFSKDSLRAFYCDMAD